MSWAKRLEKGFSWLAKLFLVLWPFLILWSVHSEHFSWMLWGSLVVFGFRVLNLSFFHFSTHKKEWLVSVLGFLLVALAIPLKKHSLVLWYPVLMNGAFFLFFATSLFVGKPMIERFALLARRGKSLPPEGQRYTRKLTVAWCVFFLVQGSIATTTVLKGDLTLWAWFNGFISYLLIGGFLGGEWIYRKWILHVDA